MENDKASKRCDTKTCSLAEQYVAAQPAKAVGTALGVGLLMSFLPVGRIVGMLVDVGFSLVRPILLGAGVCKLSEYCRTRCLANGKPEQK